MKLRGAFGVLNEGRCSTISPFNLKCRSSRRVRKNLTSHVNSLITNITSIFNNLKKKRRRIRRKWRKRAARRSRTHSCLRNGRCRNENWKDM